MLYMIPIPTPEQTLWGALTTSRCPGKRKILLSTPSADLAPRGRIGPEPSEGPTHPEASSTSARGHISERS